MSQHSSPLPDQEGSIVLGAAGGPALFTALAFSSLVWADQLSSANWPGLVIIALGLVGAKTMNLPEKGRYYWFAAGLLVLSILSLIILIVGFRPFLANASGTSAMLRTAGLQLIAAIYLYQIYRRLLPVHPKYQPRRYHPLETRDT